MKQVFFRRWSIAAVCMVVLLTVAAEAKQPAPAPAQQPAPAAPLKQDYTFKPDTSEISYFLKGNVHDTLGFVKKMTGTASATLAPDGRLTAAAVQFSFAADTMDSKDAKRDERMKKKFMEIHLYPEVTFRGASPAAGINSALALAQATKDNPIAFDLEGSLTIHGTTRQITIPVTVYAQKDLLVTEGSTVLLLKDFTIENPSFFVFRTDESVRIQFHIELQPPAAAPAGK